MKRNTKITKDTKSLKIFVSFVIFVYFVFLFRKSTDQLFVQMINDLAMLLLRTEKNDFGIASDFNCVSWRPIEKIVGRDGFFMSVSIGDRYLTFHQITPMRRLTEVILEPS